jgi:hypothetical protein
VQYDARFDIGGVAISFLMIAKSNQSRCESRFEIQAKFRSEFRGFWLRSWQIGRFAQPSPMRSVPRPMGEAFTISNRNSSGILNLGECYSYSCFVMVTGQWCTLSGVD